MKKILITGGSGFIGTNLIEHLLKKTDAELLTFDINEPKIDSHNRFWKRVDIREYEELREKNCGIQTGYSDSSGSSNRFKRLDFERLRCQYDWSK
jgi:dTDP_gluc_dehyt: dTDP-glucose 4,6-dehydratase